MNLTTKVFSIVVGIGLIGWGIFNIFNQEYTHWKYQHLVDMGENHQILGAAEVIIGVLIVIFTIYKSKKL